MAPLRTTILLTFCLAMSACSSQEDQTRKAVARGHAIAEKWCNECHRISPDEPTGSQPGHILARQVEGPSFMEVATRPNVDRDYLNTLAHETFLPMPTFRLPKNEQEDVMSYILSLKSQ